MDYQAFINRIQKKGSKKHKISHCLGSRDAWKWVRKNKWKLFDGNPVDQSLYSNIVNTVNKKIIDKLLEGHEIEFPHQMGSIRVSGVSPRVSFIDGEIKTNYRTDWVKTMQLWYEDSIAREAHKKIKRVEDTIYFIEYSTKKAKYKNKKFYKYRANRSLVKKLGEVVNNYPQRIGVLEN